MSNKIFGITVKENIPYVRTIFFLNNEIENSLSNENKSITGIDKLINIDDNCINETDFETKLTIVNNDFDGEIYNGEFHLFVNEEYTNGYYTISAISYNDKTITSEIPFLQNINIEEIKNYINDLQKITDNTEEIVELEDEQENLEKKIDDIAFITLTNNGYLDYTINCLESLKKINSDRKLKCYCVGEEGTRLLNNMRDTFFWIIRKANPSAMADLPTPGSPINKGLFFLRRLKI
jgi:hypothetical protein